MRFRLLKTKEMVRREAADWLVRLQNNREPEMERRFRRWYDADARHAGAFDRVQRTYELAGLLRHFPSAAHQSVQTASRTSTVKPRAAFAAAAALAVLVPGGVMVSRGAIWPIERTEAVMLSTQVGEIREVRLSDGSKVTLDTATKLEVEIGPAGRRVHLRYGRARFQVAPGKTPFAVVTVTAALSTQKGILDVQQLGEQTQVEILAGVADVRGSAADGRVVSLGAGQALEINSRGQVQKRPAAGIPGWTHGMLQFDDSSLSDAVALANRYSERHIVLLGNINALRVTGAFRAGDTAGFAKALAAAFGLSLSQRTDGSLVLSSGAVSLA